MSLPMRDEMSFDDYVVERFDRVDQKLDRLDLTLNGNGHPGLKQVIERHSTYFKIGGAALIAIVPIAIFIAPHIVIR